MQDVRTGGASDTPPDDPRKPPGDANGSPEEEDVGDFEYPPVEYHYIESDCSVIHPDPVAVIDLTLTPDATGDPLAFAFGLVGVLEELTKIDRSLGGSGFTVLQHKKTPAGVRVRLLTDENDGYADRLQRLCAAVNSGKDADGDDWSLPRVVSAIRAHAD